MASNFPSSSSSQALFNCNLFCGSNKLPQASRFAMAMNLKAKSSQLKAKTNARTRLSREKLEIFESPELTSWAEENFLTLLKPVEGVWQPQDLLPDPTSEGFFDTAKELRDRAAEIPDEILVCLIGNMITEEALPSYQSAANTVDRFRDETGVDATPWAMWTRMWTAEENRHGDVLNKYLYLSGRCDMKQVEKTIQYLLGAGMDNGWENSPFYSVIYTSFQERATFISHGNTARHAKRHGDATLAKICGLIAADEKRHEAAYTKLADKLFRVDPDSMMQGFAAMMRKRITMPAQLMSDGRDESLFDHFSTVSQRMGVYTARDYVEMVEFFVERWKAKEVTDLSSEGRKAQDYVCGLAERFRRMEERAQEKGKGKQEHAHVIPFSWIYDRKVVV